MNQNIELSLPHDFVVIGSGASGLFTALALLEEGYSVCIIDGGDRQPKEFLEYSKIDDLSFNSLFKDFELAKKIVLGSKLNDLSRKSDKVGSQLTPTRRYITDLAEKLLNIKSDNFFPLQSLAVGGLTQGWGAACVQFSIDELIKCGFQKAVREINNAYDIVAKEIGISSDIYPNCQPAMKVDDLHQAILNRGIGAQIKNFNLQKASLAMLSKDFNQRKKNDLSNLDFYLDKGQSVFRGVNYLESLKLKFPKLTAMHGFRVEAYKQKTNSIQLTYRDLKTGDILVANLKKLILCAGAINSGRIYLQSKSHNNLELPIISSPYFYYACAFLNRFGVSNSEKKHSLTQLIGTLTTDKSESLLQFYSYNSMMLFKLVKDINLPADYSYCILKYIIDCVSVVGHFLPQDLDGAGGMRFINEQLTIDYEQKLSKQQNLQIAEAQKVLKKLGLSLLKVQNTGSAGSIHYAGSLSKLGYKLEQNVYCADSSIWHFMPGKSPTWTIMAAAYAITKNILHESKLK